MSIPYLSPPFIIFLFNLHGLHVINRNYPNHPMEQTLFIHSSVSVPYLLISPSHHIKYSSYPNLFHQHYKTSHFQKKLRRERIFILVSNQLSIYTTQVYAGYKELVQRLGGLSALGAEYALSFFTFGFYSRCWRWLLCMLGFRYCWWIFWKVCQRCRKYDLPFLIYSCWRWLKFARNAGCILTSFVRDVADDDNDDMSVPFFFNYHSAFFFLKKEK